MDLDRRWTALAANFFTASESDVAILPFVTEPKKEVIIYTDGACSGNPGPGGWGAVLMYGETNREISGGEPYTTNNRMELMGAIQELEEMKETVRVRLQ